jgi:uncharacterized protein YkwD
MAFGLSSCAKKKTPPPEPPAQEATASDPIEVSQIVYVYEDENGIQYHPVMKDGEPVVTESGRTALKAIGTVPKADGSRDYKIPAETAVTAVGPYIIGEPSTPPTTATAVSLRSSFASFFAEKAYASETDMDIAVMAHEIFLLCNQAREKEGLPPFEWSDALSAVAALRASETMVLWSHTRPNGQYYWTAYGDLGINPNGTRENIAHGFSTAQEVFNAWMSSPGHRDAIMGNSKSIGISVAAGLGGWPIYFVQDFSKLPSVELVQTIFPDEEEEPPSDEPSEEDLVEEPEPTPDEPVDVTEPDGQAPDGQKPDEQEPDKQSPDLDGEVVEVGDEPDGPADFDDTDEIDAGDLPPGTPIDVPDVPIYIDGVTYAPVNGGYEIVSIDTIGNPDPLDSHPLAKVGGKPVTGVSDEAVAEIIAKAKALIEVGDTAGAAKLLDAYAAWLEGLLTDEQAAAIADQVEQAKAADKPSTSPPATTTPPAITPPPEAQTPPPADQTPSPADQPSTDGSLEGDFDGGGHYVLTVDKDGFSTVTVSVPYSQQANKDC